VVYVRSFPIPLILLILFICPGFAAVGDEVCHFTVTNPDSTSIYSGLAKDTVDGNIWITYWPDLMVTKYAKFNATTHSVMTSWHVINGSMWQVWSLGYGYFQNGVRNLLFEGSDIPHLKLYDPISNNYNGFLPAPFPGDTAGPAEVDLPSDYVYVCGGSSNPTKHSDYPVTQWYELMPPLSYLSAGIAVGWSRMFISCHGSQLKIYQYHISNGALQSVININGMNTNATIGDLAIGRMNAVGNHESLFACISNQPTFTGIYEIEIGDVAPGISVSPTSLGSIKSSFR
jgi:hypothetical protein